MAGIMEENAVVALESLYSGPMKDRDLARSREIFAFLQANGQVGSRDGRITLSLSHITASVDTVVAKTLWTKCSTGDRLVQGHVS